MSSCIYGLSILVFCLQTLTIVPFDAENVWLFSYAFANDTNFSQGAIRSCDQWHCLFLSDFDLKIGPFGKCDSKNMLLKTVAILAFRKRTSCGSNNN